MTRLLPVLFALLVLFMGCSDEFDLLNDEVDIADGYQKTIVAYANISPSNEYHYVRVNRGFSAENFYVGANNQDSIQFAAAEVDVRIYRIRNNDTVKTYACRDTLLEKPVGEYFNTENVILYYFREPNLLGNYTSGNIKLGLEVKEGNNVVTSQTTPIKDFNFNYPPNFSTFDISYEEEQFKVEINKPANSQAYKVIGIGRYREITDIAGDLDTVLRAFTFTIGDSYETQASSGGIKAFYQSSGVFYDAIERDVLLNGDTTNTVKRKFVDVAYHATAGNSDVALAQLTGNAYTGFTDNETTVSNMDNGLGLFSSYNESQTRYYKLSTPTVDSILTLYEYKYKFTR